MKTLRECIKEAEEKGVALGHFNFSNLDGLHAVYNAAKKLNLPVITNLMLRIRQLPLADRKAYYITHRIEDQKTW